MLSQAPLVLALLAFGAVVVGFFVSMEIVKKSMLRVKRDEAWANEEQQAPSKNVISWKTVHIRDDVASIIHIICVTNGLLLAILVVMILD